MRSDYFSVYKDGDYLHKITSDQVEDYINDLKSKHGKVGYIKFIEIYDDLKFRNHKIEVRFFDGTIYTFVPDYLDWFENSYDEIKNTFLNLV